MYLLWIKLFVLAVIFGQNLTIFCKINCPLYDIFTIIYLIFPFFNR